MGTARPSCSGCSITSAKPTRESSPRTEPASHLDSPSDVTGRFWSKYNQENQQEKLGITPEPISGLPRHNPNSLNLQRCETGDSIGPLACDFDLLIQKKSPNGFLTINELTIVQFNFQLILTMSPKRHTPKNFVFVFQKYLTLTFNRIQCYASLYKNLYFRFWKVHQLFF